MHGITLIYFPGIVGGWGGGKQIHPPAPRPRPPQEREKNPDYFSANRVTLSRSAARPPTNAGRGAPPGKTTETPPFAFPEKRG